MPDIIFEALEDYAKVYDPPVPAKQCLPDWYKNQPLYAGNKKQIGQLGDDNYVNHTIRACMPVFDHITAGYVIVTPCDIIIDTTNNQANFSWATKSMRHVDLHSPAQYENLPYDRRLYSSFICKFNSGWGVKLPVGYSLICQPPAWIPNAPFTALSGIVDADKYHLPLNFPCLIKNDYQGIIPIGTPIVQLIPFKRESWSMSTQTHKDYNDLGIERLRRIMGHGYKRLFRTKKEWN